MFKNFFNQMFSSRSSTSSKPVCETQGFATTTHADLNNDVVELYLRFLSPDEIAKIKRVSWGYYERANQVLNHYRLIDKDCQEKVGLKFLKLELSYRQNFLLVQNSQGQKQVYAWGANKVGQLGLGHDNDVNRPSLLPFPDSLANWTLNNMVASVVTTFAIFQNAEGQSQVYAWGANKFGQRGLGHTKHVNRPTLLPFPDSLANWTLNSIVYRGSNFFAIFQNAQGQSQVYAWGYNRFGQLGLGHKNPVNRPTLLPFPDSLAHWTLNNMVANGASIFAIFQNAQGQSQVYAWGANKFGQLGLGHDNDVNRPTLLPFPDSLANWTLNSIVCRGSNFFAIFQNAQGQSQVYAWGTNGFGQLGLGHNNDVNRPTLLPFPGSLANWTLNNMVASEASTFAIFQNAQGQKQVYAWGDNRFGQLGLGHNNDVSCPTLLPFPDSLAHWTLNNMVAGGASTFAIFQNAQGQKQVYAWGYNRFGQLGLGHDNDVNRPTLLPFPDSLANWTLNNIVCGSGKGSFFAIFQNQEQKQMYAWGYNPYGELGLGHNNSVHTPTLIPFFKGATGPGQLPLQKRKILNSLSSSSAVTSSTSSAPLTASSSSSHVRVPSLPGTLTSLNGQAPRPKGHKRQAGDSPEREISSATANAKKIRSSFLLESSSSSSSSSSSNPELANRLSQIKAEWDKQSANLVQSTSSSPNTPRVNSYLSSQSGLSQTASSSLTAESKQKCVTVAQPKPS